MSKRMVPEDGEHGKTGLPYFTVANASWGQDQPLGPHWVPAHSKLWCPILRSKLLPAFGKFIRKVLNGVLPLGKPGPLGI